MGPNAFAEDKSLTPFSLIIIWAEGAVLVSGEKGFSGPVSWRLRTVVPVDPLFLKGTPPGPSGGAIAIYCPCACPMLGTAGGRQGFIVIGGKWAVINL